MYRTKIWYLIALAAVLGLIWWFFQEKNAAPIADNGSQVEDGDPMGDWDTYSDGNLGFSIDHPDGVKVYQDGPGMVGLRLLGPTQSEGTEMSDGISLSFRKVTKGANDTLGQVAQSNLDQITEVGKVDQAPVSAQLGGKTGVMYRFSALGSFTVYLLPVSDTQVLEVSYMVADPKNQGYADTVDGMLGSLKVK